MSWNKFHLKILCPVQMLSSLITVTDFDIFTSHFPMELIQILKRKWFVTSNTSVSLLKYSSVKNGRIGL